MNCVRCLEPWDDRSQPCGFPQYVLRNRDETGIGLLPQVLPDIISFGLYRFETNIRSAAVLGLIGAGGMGYLMNNAFRTFAYQEACAIVVILMVLVISVDTVSARLRKLAI